MGIGALAYVACVAKDMGAVVVAVVITSFSFEDSRGIDRAIAGVAGLLPYVDNLIVIHNARLLGCVDHVAERLEAFRPTDEGVR